jgi:hypothetical protein
MVTSRKEAARALLNLLERTGARAGMSMRNDVINSELNRKRDSALNVALIAFTLGALLAIGAWGFCVMCDAGRKAYGG